MNRRILIDSVCQFHAMFKNLQTLMISILPHQIVWSRRSHSAFSEWAVTARFRSVRSGIDIASRAFCPNSRLLPIRNTVKTKRNHFLMDTNSEQNIQRLADIIYRQSQRNTKHRYEHTPILYTHTYISSLIDHTTHSYLWACDKRSWSKVGHTASKSNSQ